MRSNPRRRIQNSLPSGSPNTEGKETFDFCGLIDPTEVKMESLAYLLLRNRHEQQARQAIPSRPDLELVPGVAHYDPAQGLGSPSTKRDRIVSVDDDLLPKGIHACTLPGGSCKRTAQRASDGSSSSLARVQAGTRLISGTMPYPAVLGTMLRGPERIGTPSTRPSGGGKDKP